MKDMLDLSFAISHHLLVFSLFGVFCAELIAVRRGMDVAAVARVARVDLWYGVLAGLILVVGFSRAIFAAKGWLYYQRNVFFWAKIAIFVVIAILSVPPTIRFLAWRKAGIVPSHEAVAAVRRYLYAELALFPLLPILAAAMARGYGIL
jgi:putative membrane protein